MMHSRTSALLQPPRPKMPAWSGETTISVSLVGDLGSCSPVSASAKLPASWRAVRLV